jgi:dTDP-4-amino-4,6-dideoxygalactose transaminase
MNIPFFKPYITGKELTYMADIINNHKSMSGDGVYTKKVHEFLEKRYHVPKVLMTTSGTTALELAIRLCHLKPGDEVITPSFPQPSTLLY